MKRKWIMAVLALAAGWPAGALAQEPSPAPRPRPRPRVEREGPLVFSFSGNRGRIGVVVNTAANAERDKLGAQIEGVTPGGPAAKAGLKAGDIITKFQGTSLGGVAAEDEEESGPGMKLIELARALDPGDTVAVEYRRGTEAKRATLVAEEVQYWATTELARTPRLRIDPDLEFKIDPVIPGFGFAFGTPWEELNLVNLNPDLGEYFGTREGVLVVRAAGDSALPLKGGDVILAIDGRKPTSPSHAMRILRSYEEGEAVKIDIMRKQRRLTVTWTVPDREEGLMKRRSRPRDREEPL